MGATPLSGIEIPDLSDAANAPSFMATFGAAIEKYTIMRFTTTAARDAAITSPEEGMVAWCTTPDRVYMYTGSAWVLLAWSATTSRPGVILTDAAQSIANATVSDITWGTEVSDVDGWTSGASATLTVPSGQGGLYVATYSAKWASSPTATNFASVQINGTSAYGNIVNVNMYDVTCTFVRALAAADTIKVQVYQSSGAAINITSRLEIAWLGV